MKSHERDGDRGGVSGGVKYEYVTPWAGCSCKFSTLPSRHVVCSRSEDHRRSRSDKMLGRMEGGLLSGVKMKRTLESARLVYQEVDVEDVCPRGPV